MPWSAIIQLRVRYGERMLTGWPPPVWLTALALSVELGLEEAYTCPLVLDARNSFAGCGLVPGAETVFTE